MTTLVWFRTDLRLTDNPALRAAAARNEPTLAVYIDAPDEESPWQPGGASQWWLGKSLASLEAQLRDMGSRLIIRTGPSLAALQDLVRESRATAVFWNRRYEPAIIARDTHIKQSLRADGLVVRTFNAALLHEPWTIQNQSARPFQVFTPFWKHCMARDEPARPLAAPRTLPSPARWPSSASLDDVNRAPAPEWARSIADAWAPGVHGAATALRRFLRSAYPDYTQHRNRPDLAGTSRLSPHLHFGEISPRQVWHAVRKSADSVHDDDWMRSQFITELGWREFAHHLLFHFPRTPVEPLRERFAEFSWRRDDAALRAWQRGRTGFPIVDAGMRELWRTGWMHNRVRMIVASFLVKDLLIAWHEGARWFWDTLVDADLASNTMGWQWGAGCGADAAPYFRIFNPTLQGERFDPEGDYVRRWCPELATLPVKWIHEPVAAPAAVLQSAGVELGVNYPLPIVNHSTARREALEAYARTR